MARPSAKMVLTDIVYQRLQTRLENAKVERARALVNLDGIAAAQGDARLDFSREIGEITPGASAAIGPARQTDGLHAPGPNVRGEQAPIQGFGMAREDFQGFGCFERGDQIDDGAEDADGVAGFFEALGGAGFEQAGQAGRSAGTNCHGEAVTGNGSGVDPGAAGSDSDIVH